MDAVMQRVYNEASMSIESWYGGQVETSLFLLVSLNFFSFC